ncbi:MAG: DUF2802 domain-containing protein [Desulfobacterales bacterium]|nr:DUF2802 domain-containing protein [Desulfobacterales bacterium]
MAFHYTLFWEIVLNIIALFACLVVIWGLIRLKRKSGRKPAPSAGAHAPEAFDEVVRDELARQTSPAPIIEDQPAGISSLPTIEEQPIGIASPPTIEEQPVRRPAPPAADEVAAPSDDMYETAKRLAASGLTAEEIEGKVTLTRSEIDLIMKLKEYGH